MAEIKAISMNNSDLPCCYCRRFAGLNFFNTAFDGYLKKPGKLVSPWHALSAYIHALAFILKNKKTVNGMENTDPLKTNGELSWDNRRLYAWSLCPYNYVTGEFFDKKRIV